MRSGGNLQNDLCMRGTTSLIFVIALAIMIAGCGGASDNGNAAAKVEPNTADVAIDVAPANTNLKASDSIDADAAPAASGKEIKPVDGFKLKSIEPLEGTVLGGVLNDYALSLPEPKYPSEAQAANASGKVPVEVIVNEKGVVSAVSVVEGPQPLRAAAAAAAREAKFGPFLKDGKPVKVAGVINYEFAD